jgi:hypothetical protein
MRRNLTAAVLVTALAFVGTGRSASMLCVGGPHCYATIQAAVDAADDGSAIRIAPGTYAGGIVVAKSVELDGSGAAATTISGGGPVVTIGSAATAPTVTISGVTITGGRTSSDPQAPRCGPDVPTCGPGYASATALGGGIEAFQGTTVTIRSSVVTGNRAEPRTTVNSVKAVCPGPQPCPASFGDAAGIDNWGTMALISTTVSDNHAAAVQSNGGGIVDEAHATLTLRDSQVTGNSATAAAPFGRFASGGGIFVGRGGTLTVGNSSIDGNTAALASSIPHPYPMQDGGTDQSNAFAGGVFVNDGAGATFRNSTLDGNRVTVEAPAGEPFGADPALCACGNAPLVVENSKVVGNALTVNVRSSADVGPSGGILEADGSATIANSHIDDNSVSVNTPNGDAEAFGALLFLYFGGTPAPSVANSTISGNTVTATAPAGAATVQGVGLLNNGPAALTNVQVDRNVGTAIGVRGFADGGGIWNGQFFAGPESPLTLVNTRVGDNALRASPGIEVHGGGIYTPGFPTTLDHSVVAHNTPDDCFGCG